MRAGVPTQCDVGVKRNSKGFKETWIGYKLHLDTASNGVPVAAILTAASTHDSQVMTRSPGPANSASCSSTTSHGFRVCDAQPIIGDCLAAGRVPVIDRSTRRDTAPGRNRRRARKAPVDQNP